MDRDGGKETREEATSPLPTNEAELRDESLWNRRKIKDPIIPNSTAVRVKVLEIKVLICGTALKLPSYLKVNLLFDIQVVSTNQ